MHQVFFVQRIEHLFIQSRGHTIKNRAVAVNNRDRVAAAGTGGGHRIVFKFSDAGSHITQNDVCHGSLLRQVICMIGKVSSGGKSRLSFRRSETGNRQLLPAGGICR